MKGSIRQRTKGSWEVTIDLGRDGATGRRLRHYESIRGGKKLAQQRLAELLVSFEQGSYIKPKRITLGEWFENWLNGYVATNCSPKTAQSYQSEVHCHLTPALGRIPLAQLQPQHVQNYYSHALSQGRADGKGGLSKRTVLYHHCILFEALNYAVRQGVVARNVAQAVDPPRPERKGMTILTSEQLTKFWNCAQETPYYEFFYTLYCTGLRRGEGLALRWRNVDLDMACFFVVETAYKLNGTYIIRQPKTAKSRRGVALPPSLALLLREYKAGREVERLLLGKRLTDDDFVFADASGAPLNPDTVTHAFGKLIRKAGLPHARLHDLRHTHATLMLKEGIHPKIVQERLGHSNIATTLDIYSHVVPGLQEAAAERFDKLLTRENVGKMSAGRPGPDSGR